MIVAALAPGDYLALGFVFAVIALVAWRWLD